MKAPHISAAATSRAAVVGGSIWVVAIAVEYAKDLQPPAPGALFYLDQIAFVAALCCWVTAIIGLHDLGAAGQGRSRLALPIWAAAIGLLAIGNVVSLFLHAFASGAHSVYDDNPLFPIGGIVSLVAALVAGVAVARAGRLGGWARWIVLVYAVYYLCALFLPLVFGAEPNLVTEGLWGVAWILIGYAVRKGTQTGSFGTRETSA